MSGEGERQNHAEATSTYPGIMDTGTPSTYQGFMDKGTPSTYQEIMQDYGDYLIGAQQQTSKVNYFEGHGLSYTQMWFGVEKSAEGQHYNNFYQGPATDENKLYMITGRCFDGNAGMEEEDECCDQLQDNSSETTYMFHEDDASNFYFDDNIPQNVDNSDGEWDEPSPQEYDIFGDAQPPDASTDQEPANATVQEAPNACTAEQPSSSDPASASPIESHAQTEATKEPVELLSQQDIEDFLEIENEESCSQEVRRQHTPHLGMIFDSDEEAYHFYNEYAAICGFSVKKARNYHAKKAGGAGHTRSTFSCNKSRKIPDQDTLEARKKRRQERKQENTCVVPVETQKIRRANVVQITGCLAKMVVSLRNGKWEVISVDLEHNHELSPPDETKFLRSHKHMTEQEKLFIRTFNSVKLPTRKIMAILAYLRGGVGTLPYTKKYVSNVRTAIRNECRQNDMTQVLEYFRKRKQADPRFFYDFELGEGNKVLSIFWSDEYSRKMYDLYGDCVSFDTTYKTNRYNLPFAPFVGVTGHGNNCLFACAFFQNETTDVFKWLFKTFRECMGNKDPSTIIID